ncbi:ComEA family DNA-binding protein [Rhodoferax sp.]|uniref:ComEA family DNA-binding protein n=1 Tax=Rhodoferax sp. TaxID=50421 RepID=UPI00374DB7C0
MLKNILLAACVFASSLAWGGTDVNQASVAELDSIRGIGPALSRKILAEREQGKLKDWVDFMARVPGVKAKTAEKFSAQGLTVDGSAFNATAKP